MLKWLKEQLITAHAPEATLVFLAKRGDRNAFGQLYLKHLDAIYRFIFFRVSCDQPIAEDLTELTFFKAWKKLDLYQPKIGGTLKAWLFRIAHNVIIDHYRSSKLTQGLSVSIPDEGINLVGDLENRVLVEEILNLINQLPDEQRNILILTCIEGLSSKEAARVLKKSEESIRTTKSRSLKNIREKLKSSNDKTK
jgi:RNA polymerase sigma-70 factor (ECF subfamily)